VTTISYSNRVRIGGDTSVADVDIVAALNILAGEKA
jgi:hypothetical protein